MDKQSPHLQDTHIEFICACSARDLSPVQILSKMRLMYPEFNDIDDSRMSDRIRSTRTRCIDEIEEMREKETLDHISLARPEFRLEYLERLLINPPENLTQILRILDQARKETEKLDSAKSESSGSITWGDLTSMDDVLSKPIPKNKTGIDEEDEEDDVDTPEASIT